MLRKAKQLNLLLDLTSQLFDSVVLPVLMYGGEVLAPYPSTEIEKVHLKFCKYILSVPNTTTSAMAYAELGRMPLEIKIKTKALFFWSKLVTGKPIKLSYILYFLLLILHNENIYSSEWITFIIDTLDGCGLSYVWLEQEYMNREYVKRRVQLTLEDQYLQSWKQSLFDSNKCKFYRIIKKEFKLENYHITPPI